jgi:hypothetical protein
MWAGKKAKEDLKAKQMKNQDKRALLRIEFQNKNIVALNIRKIDIFIIG